MPKRDVAYMEGQRDQIARAALETMLEKGFDETSLRDVAKTAGVSTGALYVHFANKEDLFLAASRLSWREANPETAEEDVDAKCWQEYAENLVNLKYYLTTDRGRRRFRLSMQFTADQAVRTESRREIDPLYREYSSWFLRNLQALHERGEIAMPMGLETTAQIHYSLVIGTTYLLVLNKALDVETSLSGLRSALELTAGVINPTANQS